MNLIVAAAGIYLLSDLDTAIMCLIAWVIAYEYFEHCESKVREKMLNIGKDSRDRFDSDDEYDQWIDSLAARKNDEN